MVRHKMHVNLRKQTTSGKNVILLGVLHSIVVLPV